MIAAGEFALRFRQVERGAVGFGVGGNEVDEERNELQPAEDVLGDDALCGLLLDDLAEIERTRAENDADQRKAKCQFVADQLR